MIQTLDAGLHSDEVVVAPNFETPTAWGYLDGVISIATATSRSYLHELEAAGKAVVLASDEIDSFTAPAATPDNAGGVTEAVHHLIGHGHTRIGYTANLIQTDMRARHDAYRLAMIAHGLEPEAKWFFNACDNGERGGRERCRTTPDCGHAGDSARVCDRSERNRLHLATDRTRCRCAGRHRNRRVRRPRGWRIYRPTLSTVLQPFDEIGALQPDCCWRGCAVRPSSPRVQVAVRVRATGLVWMCRFRVGTGP